LIHAFDLATLTEQFTKYCLCELPTNQNLSFCWSANQISRPPDGRESHGLDRFCVRPYSKLGPEFQVNVGATTWIQFRKIMPLLSEYNFASYIMSYTMRPNYADFHRVIPTLYLLTNTRPERRKIIVDLWTISLIMIYMGYITCYLIG
jgi:hypothetical protein